MNNSAIVFDLQAENRYEIATIDYLDNWLDPIKFSMTGFDCKIFSKAFSVNMEQNLGFEHPMSATGLKGLVRGFAEIDLR